jgi:undecaprenyl-phosphate galactose phosphotransferase/putative colanic acid biosynthesis UDP-glucose lipid carrier transferase
MRGGESQDFAGAGPANRSLLTTPAMNELLLLAEGRGEDEGVAKHPGVALAIKRLFDIAVATVGLIAAAPLLGLLAVLIRLDSRGPVFYRQARIGRGDRPFTILKLRSMDAGERITRIGRLLRPMGLDELTQLWNVLKGDMSIVGPRPEVLSWWPAWTEYPGHRARHAMRPGITGWAQVNGLRGKVPIARRLTFDLAYVRGWSLGLDVRVLMRTLATVWSDTRRTLRS